MHGMWGNYSVHSAGATAADMTSTTASKLQMLPPLLFSSSSLSQQPPTQTRHYFTPLPISVLRQWCYVAASQPSVYTKARLQRGQSAGDHWHSCPPCITSCTSLPRNSSRCVCRGIVTHIASLLFRSRFARSRQFLSPCTCAIRRKRRLHRCRLRRRRCRRGRRALSFKRPLARLLRQKSSGTITPRLL
jgi:hypothetical protein